ncbi:hypothetical protein VTO42DRAFT_47 [Malbranchea cinnamomea]
MGEEPSLEDRIASLVHAHFNALPERSKPKIHANGKREWIPLSGIVLVTGENTPQEELTCVALATGAKCLSQSQISNCQGLVLHDGHAEILALRAFNHWLLEECRSLLIRVREHQDGRQQLPEDGNIGSASEPMASGSDEGNGVSGTRFLRWRKGVLSDATGLKSRDIEKQFAIGAWPPFELVDDLSIWMYCTCAPCGDASMELCMAAQEDPTPWEVSSNCQGSSDEAPPTKQLLDGRAFFSILGVVRRKPSRADAEPTLSKSCSDKLAVKQVTSILSFPTSILVAPTQSAYIKNLLLPDDEISRVACDRCFGSGEGGRLKPLKNRIWSDSSAPGVEYVFRPFQVRSLPTDRFEELWQFGKSKDPTEAKNYKPGNISAVWTAAPSHPCLSHSFKRPSPGTNLNETLVNGVRQGYHVSSSNSRKASAISRARMWDLLREVMELLPTPLLGNRNASTLDTYGLLKQRAAEVGSIKIRSEVLADVREVLGNWIRNRGDDSWSLGVLKESKPFETRRQAQASSEKIANDAKVDKNTRY